MRDLYDVAVVGAGPAGYTAALKASGLGLNVLLAEKEQVGGVCLNRGCIPSKCLLSDAENVHWSKRAAAAGIINKPLAVNYAAMVRRKNLVVNKIVTNLGKHLQASGVHLLAEKVAVTEPGHLETQSGAIVNAEKVILATGSKPFIPSIQGFNLPGVITTRQMLDLEELPSELVIIGGGVIGQEFAWLSAVLGSSVTILEMLPRVLAEVDEEIARRYASFLPALGIKTETGSKILSIEQQDGRLVVVYVKGEKEKRISADKVLVACGRKPNLCGIELDGLALEPSTGAVLVDPSLKTSIEDIYAVGDATGRKMLAHVASYHGEIAAFNIGGYERTCRDDVVPSCIFTWPQIAWVGINQEQALTRGLSFRTSVFPLSASGKAKALEENIGLIKLIEDRSSGKIIGAHLLGPNVSELIGEAALAVRMGSTAQDLVETIHAHPTIAEAFREAAMGFLDGPIHSAPRVKSFSL
ncbi:MAG: dihydrolipoamide dehydrogenase [Thermodesulfobacteriota bacterium]|nr:dihydrolipoamide dehydrogenase [Thermodesulfobacteriota bacterium]